MGSHPSYTPMSPDLEALPYLGNFQEILGKVDKPISSSHQCSWSHHPPPPLSELSLQDAPGRKGVYKKGAPAFLFDRTESEGPGTLGLCSVYDPSHVDP